MNNYLAEFNVNQLETEVNKATGARNLSGGLADIFNDSGGNLGLTTLAFFIAGGAALTYLVYGGIMLMTSAADPKKVAGAHETIKNALIGLLIVVFSYTIVRLVGFILGLGDFALF